MNRYVAGACILGADDLSTALVVDRTQKAQNTQPVRPSTSGSGTSWQTIAGMALAVVATVALAPKLIKWVG